MANFFPLCTCCLLFFLSLLTSLTCSGIVDDHPTVRYVLQEVQDLRTTIISLGEKLNTQEEKLISLLSNRASNAKVLDSLASIGSVPVRVIEALEKRISDKLKGTLEANEKRHKAEIEALHEKSRALERNQQLSALHNSKTLSTRFTSQMKEEPLNDDNFSYNNLYITLSSALQQYVNTNVEGILHEKLKSFNRSMIKTVDAKDNHLLRRMYTIERLNPARTCQELVNADPTLGSGNYYIDPDGLRVGDPPIRVRCEKSGETIVVHDAMEKIRVKQCAEPGCYSRNVTYGGATMRQIQALIQLSSDCSQYLRFDCTAAPLWFSGVAYAWWNDRSGNRRYYWTGNSIGNTHTCSCGLRRNCNDKNLNCNCDASAGSPLFDEGTITNDDHLPITRLNFGRLLSGSKGEHTLGPLRCSGARRGSNEKPTSCAGLWQSGRLTHTGLYHVQDEDGAVLMLHCDTSKLPGESGFDNLLGVTNNIRPTFVVENEAIVVDVSAYKGRRLMVETARGRILAFQPVESESLGGAFKFIKVINTEDGTHVTVDSNKMFNPRVRHSGAAKKAIYTKSNRAIIEFTDDIPDGISIKISKAVECPFYLEGGTRCGRVVDAESCYCAVFTNRTWQEQNTFCKTNGFSLLTLESAQEEQAIGAAWPSEDFWTSLNDRDKEGTWVWDATGATLTSSHYANWYSDQPDDNDGSENCVDLYDGGWYDTPCSENWGAICEQHP